MKLFVFSLPLLAAMALNVPAVRAADAGGSPVQIQSAVYYPEDRPVQVRPAGVSVGASVQVFPVGGPYYYVPAPVVVYPRPYYYAPPPVYYYSPRVYTYSSPYYHSYPYYRSGFSFNWYGGHRHHGWYGGHRWPGHGWYGGHRGGHGGWYRWK